MYILRQRSTHAGKLERWLGRNECERISAGMRDWYGPDIAVAATPGLVYARKGGDFVGSIDGGGFTNLLDTAATMAKHWMMRQRLSFNAGFADLADLQFEATKGGKRRSFTFIKSGLNVAGQFNDSWTQITYPVTGASGGAAPAGTAWTDASTGAWPFNNPDSGDTQFFVSGELLYDAANTQRTALLYDRLFSVAKTMSSTATEAVTGVPTRYQSTTSTNAGYAAGNFLFPATLTAIAATAHNWTVCQYTDQDGNASTLPSIAGVASAAQRAVDLAAPFWFMPLETGDIGVQTLTQMQCDASVATGTIDFTIGHPIAWLPSVGPLVTFAIDAINSAFQVTQIMDDAALALLFQSGFSGAAGSNCGSFQTVTG